MTSKQRILAAMARQEIDYLPCSIYFNSNLRVPGYDLTQPEQRVRLQVDLGADPVVHTGLGAAGHPVVKTRCWIEPHAADVDGPVLYKQWQTPAGTLRQSVRFTADWPYGQELRWGDFSAGHCCEPLIKSPADVEAFRYVHAPPTRADLAAALPAIQRARALADRYDVALCALAGHGLATLMFAMGAEAMVLFAVDHPGAFKELARIDHETNVARIRLLAEAGVDLLKRFGGYEQTNFFSPAIFDEVVAPLLRKEVAVAREVGLPIYYRVVTGMGPLLERIAAIGFDCVEGFEPVLSRSGNQDVLDALGGKACIWTGVSSPGHLGRTDDGPVRRAVRDAVDVFGRRGFILGVTNSIRSHWPWANTLAMIDEWKKLR